MRAKLKNGKYLLIADPANNTTLAWSAIR